MDGRTHESIQQAKRMYYQIPCLAHYNAQNEIIITTDASTKGLGATLWQQQKDGNSKPVGFASKYLSDTEKNYDINELLGKRNTLDYTFTESQSNYYKPTKRWKHSSKETDRMNHSARVTRWLDRLAHFDINIKHIAGKHLALTDSLSRNTISEPERIENYHEEYVINCVKLLLQFINNYSSVASQRKLEA